MPQSRRAAVAKYCCCHRLRRVQSPHLLATIPLAIVWPERRSHYSTGPRTVVDQSSARMRAPISPPPANTDSINCILLRSIVNPSTRHRHYLQGRTMDYYCPSGLRAAKQMMNVARSRALRSPHHRSCRPRFIRNQAADSPVVMFVFRHSGRRRHAHSRDTGRSPGPG
jgi:hypothetical protein